jgi:hypothetical protein
MSFKSNLLVIPLLALAIIAGSCRSTPYEKAFDLYDSSFKKYGDAFYRMPEYKETLALLNAIPADSPDYQRAQELVTKLTDDRRDFRTRNARALLEQAKARFAEDERLKKELKQGDKSFTETPKEESVIPKK